MKFPNLPASGALGGSEVVPVTQGGVDKRTTTQDIANLADPAELAFSDPDFTATNVKDAILEAGDMGGNAADVTYDNTVSGLAATNVKDAIDEVAGASPGSGDVTGPGSSTDGNFAVFDGAGGDAIKDGGTPGGMAFINDAPSDGTGYVRKDGAWAAESGGGGGGLTNFTEGINSSSPNASVPVVFLNATNAASDVDIVIHPKGNGGFSLDVADGTSAGGNKRGVRAVDLQRSRSNADEVASGNYSFLGGGNRNKVTGQYAGSIGGDRNTNGGQSSASVGGTQNTNSGNNAASLGGSTCTNSGTFSASVASEGSTASGSHSAVIASALSTADADYAIATGLYSTVRGIYGAHAHASGAFGGTKGDCQHLEVPLRAATTNATPTALTSNGSSASTNNQFVLPDYSAVILKAIVVARSNTAGESKTWDVTVHAKRQNGAGTTSIVQADVTDFGETSAVGWSLAVSADTTNGAVQFAVTGAASTNIYTSADIYTSIVAKGY